MTDKVERDAQAQQKQEEDMIKSLSTPGGHS